MDRNQRLQPPRPPADENCVDEKVEQYCEYTEKGGKVVGMWWKGVVVRITKGNNVHIQWDAKYLRPEDLKITHEENIILKWNKSAQFGWRIDPDFF